MGTVRDWACKRPSRDSGPSSAAAPQMCNITSNSVSPFGFKANPAALQRCQRDRRYANLIPDPIAWLCGGRTASLSLGRQIAPGHPDATILKRQDAFIQSDAPSYHPVQYTNPHHTTPHVTPCELAVCRPPPREQYMATQQTSLARIQHSSHWAPSSHLTRTDGG